jgi:hypothetical protein
MEENYLIYIIINLIKCSQNINTILVNLIVLGLCFKLVICWSKPYLTAIYLSINLFL